MLYFSVDPPSVTNSSLIEVHISQANVGYLRLFHGDTKAKMSSTIDKYLRERSTFVSLTPLE